MNALHSNSSTVPNQVLTFSLGAEHFGVDILRVQEIRGWSPVTRIPESPAHVLGVLSLRGVVVPVVDLRVRFGLAPVECTALTVIIVLSFYTPSGSRLVGLLVDRVSDVIDFAAENLRPMPSLEGKKRNTFVQTLAMVDEQVYVLLDIDQLISFDVDDPHLRPPTVS